MTERPALDIAALDRAAITGDLGAAPAGIPAQPAYLPQPLVPIVKMEALLALAAAGVDVAELREIGRGALSIGFAPLEIWLRLNRQTIAEKLAFYRRGA